MQKTLFIFHGTEGHPKENWFPWLKEKVEANSEYQVIVPQFPSPPVVPAKLDEWSDVLKEHEHLIDENTIIIGHSLGGDFTLRVLEKISLQIKAAGFVGTPIGVRPILNYDRDSSFTPFDFDWENIKTKAKHFIVFQSDDDPYVCLGNGETLAKNLGVELSFVPNAGHFNAKAGYTEFNELWEKLQSLLG